MPLVAGIDSSTQACKVVVRDAESGRLVRHGRGPHPPGSEVDPQRWLTALERACKAAGGVRDVAAISIAAQQHGCICLDENCRVVRPALLWNDMRSAAAADQLVQELGGPEQGARAWADAVGSVPLASFTVAKLRWIAEHEPRNAMRTVAVCLPHDWLSWRISERSAPRLDQISTDRSDASGTGYFSPRDGTYRNDLLELAFGRSPHLPPVLGIAEAAGSSRTGAVLGAGMGDNAGAALGLAIEQGDVLISIGTSGTVMSVSREPSADASAIVAGFADATGRFLPLVCTLNAAGVLKAGERMLGVDHDGLSQLALSAPAGAGGLVLVPYLDGERTPNVPNATGALHGLTHENSTPAHLARATIEGLLCGLADGLDALVENGIDAQRVLLIGGGSRSQALRELAPAILGRPVVVPAPAEYVADGAARQAAWALAGAPQEPWPAPPSERFEADADERVRARYAEARELFVSRLPVQLRGE